MATQSYRARWIIPVSGPPLRDAVLTVRNGRIVELKEAPAESSLDLGDAVIVPALVNAHTHLEFSQLQSPLGEPNMPFVEWIKRVVAWRRERDAGWDTTQGASPPHVAAIQAGIEESLRAGASLIGEIATSRESAAQLERSPANGVAFWEVIGWSASSIAGSLDTARAFVRANSSSNASVIRGISPHAPYTVHQELLRQIVQLSASEGFPIAMHLAETQAELELLSHGTGLFAEMLQGLNAWEPLAVMQPSRPLAYLRLLFVARRALVIHGNYLDDDEIQFLARHRDKMSVVYCPRTHAYFGHQQYPLEKMLAVGVHVALGTDSRASNPDLNLWNEVRFAASRHSRVAPETWLKIATLHGAESLGIDRDYGSLEVGKVGSFLVIPLPHDKRDDAWSWFYEDWKPRIITKEHD